MCRIYPPLFRMTFGHLSLWANYPERQALYPVSVRHIKCLPKASFRFLIAQDTLAFGYGIPVIRAPWGLASVNPTHPLGLLHARHTNYGTSTRYNPRENTHWNLANNY